jgi:hypothetical protein
VWRGSREQIQAGSYKTQRLDKQPPTRLPQVGMVDLLSSHTFWVVTVYLNVLLSQANGCLRDLIVSFLSFMGYRPPRQHLPARAIKRFHPQKTRPHPLQSVTPKREFPWIAASQTRSSSKKALVWPLLAERNSLHPTTRSAVR